MPTMDWLFRYQSRLWSPVERVLAALLCGEVQPVGRKALESFFIVMAPLDGLPIYFQQGTIE